MMREHFWTDLSLWVVWELMVRKLLELKKEICLEIKI